MTAPYKVPKELSGKQLMHLAAAHIRHYQNMIQSGHPAVRRAESGEYIRLWRRIQNKAIARSRGARLDLSMREDYEIRDALLSEEYQKLLEDNK